VTRVVLRGNEAYRDGHILVPPGFGKNIRPELPEATGMFPSSEKIS